MKERDRLCVSLTLNVLIFALEVFAIIVSIFEYGGASFLVYYTQESNVLLALACFLTAREELGELRRAVPGSPGSTAEGSALPRAGHSTAVRTLKYAATCCTTITLLVVLTPLVIGIDNFTGGTREIGMFAAVSRVLLHDSAVFMHLLCPVLALVSLFAFERERCAHLCFGAVLWAELPTALYAAVTTPLNIARVIYGPYFFLHVYEQPVWQSVMWCALIVGGGFVTDLIIWTLLKVRRKSS